MKINYNNGKIYRISSYDDNSLVYIGSTTKQLSQRMGQHRISYKYYKIGKCGKISSFDVFDAQGIENCYIELIENYPCNNKDELNKQEGIHIRKNICVNKNIAGRTLAEYYAETKDDKAIMRNELVKELKTIATADLEAYHHYLADINTTIDAEPVFVEMLLITNNIVNDIGFDSIRDDKTIDAITFDKNMSNMMLSNVIYTNRIHVQRLFNIPKIMSKVSRKSFIGYINTILSRSLIRIKCSRNTKNGKHVSKYSLVKVSVEMAKNSNI